MAHGANGLFQFLHSSMFILLIQRRGANSGHTFTDILRSLIYNYTHRWPRVNTNHFYYVKRSNKYNLLESDLEFSLIL